MLLKSMDCVPHTTQTMTRNSSYYQNGIIRCLKCPAGNFVKKDCVISNTQGVCEMCNPGKTFSEYETGLDRCLTCTRCREDQEELSPCNITKNTVCQCKNGTYCPANSPCNKCLLCSSSCPSGQVLQQTCNTTSDIVCVPVRTRLSVRSWTIPVVIIGIGCPAVFFCCLLKYRLIGTPSSQSLDNNTECSYGPECGDLERKSQETNPAGLADKVLLQQQVTADVRSYQGLPPNSPLGQCNGDRLYNVLLGNTL
ncbi:tumor necrosis factor receptor superfamily member 22-like isoform X2 [Hyla sarda]|uniref:tumor necrosis factor receptor superfamily member 22-like isoform X2 n=1 Tax=Hyla sarda TaxID=327740 RepID=UPI0024C4651D|nr:tumor necrosis factor receptor superfamily member 22-like isoform X2 [Hyla sarda]